MQGPGRLRVLAGGGAVRQSLQSGQGRRAGKAAQELCSSLVAKAGLPWQLTSSIMHVMAVPVWPALFPAAVSTALQMVAVKVLAPVSDDMKTRFMKVIPPLDTLDQSSNLDEE